MKNILSLQIVKADSRSIYVNYYILLYVKGFLVVSLCINASFIYIIPTLKKGGEGGFL